ncbi:MAG: CDP-diacylglycerol--glycerol-3-phosphate 3-phosphatidyltransferase [Clostridia bacterium]|nr:CDP-diacylglycerol--glycerol-3-phosphate 3-phosphatidyltransferase [Clostridia bacterium]
MAKTIHKNLPNALTIFRMICVPFFMAFIMLEGFPRTAGGASLNVLVAGIIFGVAMFTDLLDGKLARKYNLVSDFGKLWDPLADKLMVLAALLGLMLYGRCSAFVVLIVVARELIISGFRATAAGSGKVIAANMWGKAKTVTQTAYIGLTLLLIFLQQLGLPETSTFYMSIEPVLDVVAVVLEVAMTLLTIVSGVIYFAQNGKK